MDASDLGCKKPGEGEKRAHPASDGLVGYHVSYGAGIPGLGNRMVGLMDPSLVTSDSSAHFVPLRQVIKNRSKLAPPRHRFVESPQPPAEKLKKTFEKLRAPQRKGIHNRLEASTRLNSHRPPKKRKQSLTGGRNTLLRKAKSQFSRSRGGDRARIPLSKKLSNLLVEHQNPRKVFRQIRDETRRLTKAHNHSADHRISTHEPENVENVRRSRRGSPRDAMLIEPQDDCNDFLKRHGIKPVAISEPKPVASELFAESRLPVDSERSLDPKGRYSPSKWHSSIPIREGYLSNYAPPRSPSHPSPRMDKPHEHEKGSRRRADSRSGGESDFVRSLHMSHLTPSRSFARDTPASSHRRKVSFAGLRDFSPESSEMLQKPPEQDGVTEEPHPVVTQNEQADEEVLISENREVDGDRKEALEEDGGIDTKHKVEITDILEKDIPHMPESAGHKRDLNLPEEQEKKQDSGDTSKGIKNKWREGEISEPDVDRVLQRLMKQHDVTKLISMPTNELLALLDEAEKKQPRPENKTESKKKQPFRNPTNSRNPPPSTSSFRHRNPASARNPCIRKVAPASAHLVREKKIARENTNTLRSRAAYRVLKEKKELKTLQSKLREAKRSAMSEYDRNVRLMNKASLSKPLKIPRKSPRISKNSPGISEEFMERKKMKRKPPLPKVTRREKRTRKKSRPGKSSSNNQTNGLGCIEEESGETQDSENPNEKEDCSKNDAEDEDKQKLTLKERLEKSNMDNESNGEPDEQKNDLDLKSSRKPKSEEERQKLQEFMRKKKKERLAREREKEEKKNERCTKRYTALEKLDKYTKRTFKRMAQAKKSKAKLLKNSTVNELWRRKGIPKNRARQVSLSATNPLEVSIGSEKRESTQVPFRRRSTINRRTRRMATRSMDHVTYKKDLREDKNNLVARETEGPVGVFRSTAQKTTGEQTLEKVGERLRSLVEFGRNIVSQRAEMKELIERTTSRIQMKTNQTLDKVHPNPNVKKPKKARFVGVKKLELSRVHSDVTDQFVLPLGSPESHHAVGESPDDSKKNSGVKCRNEQIGRYCGIILDKWDDITHAYKKAHPDDPHEVTYEEFSAGIDSFELASIPTSIRKKIWKLAKDFCSSDLDTIKLETLGSVLSSHARSEPTSSSCRRSFSEPILSEPIRSEPIQSKPVRTELLRSETMPSEPKGSIAESKIGIQEGENIQDGSEFNSEEMFGEKSEDRMMEKTQPYIPQSPDGASEKSNFTQKQPQDNRINALYASAHRLSERLASLMKRTGAKAPHGLFKGPSPIIHREIEKEEKKIELVPRFPETSTRENITPENLTNVHENRNDLSPKPYDLDPYLHGTWVVGVDNFWPDRGELDSHHVLDTVRSLWDGDSVIVTGPFAFTVPSKSDFKFHFAYDTRSGMLKSWWNDPDVKFLLLEKVHKDIKLGVQNIEPSPRFVIPFDADRVIKNEAKIIGSSSTQELKTKAQISKPAGEEKDENEAESRDGTTLLGEENNENDLAVESKAEVSREIRDAFERAFDAIRDQKAVLIRRSASSPVGASAISSFSAFKDIEQKKKVPLEALLIEADEDDEDEDPFSVAAVIRRTERAMQLEAENMTDDRESVNLKKIDAELTSDREKLLVDLKAELDEMRHETKPSKALRAPSKTFAEVTSARKDEEDTDDVLQENMGIEKQLYSTRKEEDEENLLVENELKEDKGLEANWEDGEDIREEKEDREDIREEKEEAAVEAEVRLNYDLCAVPKKYRAEWELQFKAEFLRDMSKCLDEPEERFEVTGIKEGSIYVTMKIHPHPGRPSPENVLRALKKMLQNSNSLLYQLPITAHCDGAYLNIDTVYPDPLDQNISNGNVAAPESPSFTQEKPAPDKLRDQLKTELEVLNKLEDSARQLQSMQQARALALVAEESNNIARKLRASAKQRVLRRRARDAELIKRRQEAERTLKAKEDALRERWQAAEEQKVREDNFRNAMRERERKLEAEHRFAIQKAHEERHQERVELENLLAKQRKDMEREYQARNNDHLKQLKDIVKVFDQSVDSRLQESALQQEKLIDAQVKLAEGRLKEIDDLRKMILDTQAMDLKHREAALAIQREKARLKMEELALKRENAKNEAQKEKKREARIEAAALEVKKMNLSNREKSLQDAITKRDQQLQQLIDQQKDLSQRQSDLAKMAEAAMRREPPRLPDVLKVEVVGGTNPVRGLAPPLNTVVSEEKLKYTAQDDSSYSNDFGDPKSEDVTDYSTDFGIVDAKRKRIGSRDLSEVREHSTLIGGRTFAKQNEDDIEIEIEDDIHIQEVNTEDKDASVSISIEDASQKNSDMTGEIDDDVEIDDEPAFVDEVKDESVSIEDQAAVTASIPGSYEDQSIEMDERSNFSRQRTASESNPESIAISIEEKESVSRSKQSEGTSIEIDVESGIASGSGSKVDTYADEFENSDEHYLGDPDQFDEQEPEIEIKAEDPDVEVEIGKQPNDAEEVGEHEGLPNDDAEIEVGDEEILEEDAEIDANEIEIGDEKISNSMKEISIEKEDISDPNVEIEIDDEEIPDASAGVGIDRQDVSDPNEEIEIEDGEDPNEEIEIEEGEIYEQFEPVTGGISDGTSYTTLSGDGKMGNDSNDYSDFAHSGEAKTDLDIVPEEDDMKKKLNEVQSKGRDRKSFHGSKARGKDDPRPLEVSISDPREWTEGQVATWVGSVAPAYKSYSEKFFENGIDGISLVELDENDLKHIGMEKGFHRRRLLREVGKVCQFAGVDAWGPPARIPPYSPRRKDSSSGLKSDNRAADEADEKENERMSSDNAMPEGDPREWTGPQVGNWVGSVAPAYKKFRTAFEENGVDGPTLVELDEEDLKELGLTKGFQRRRLLREIGKACQSAGVDAWGPPARSPLYSPPRGGTSNGSHGRVIVRKPEEIGNKVETKSVPNLHTSKSTSMSKPSENKHGEEGAGGTHSQRNSSYSFAEGSTSLISTNEGLKDLHRIVDEKREYTTTLDEPCLNPEQTGLELGAQGEEDVDDATGVEIDDAIGVEVDDAIEVEVDDAIEVEVDDAIEVEVDDGVDEEIGSEGGEIEVDENGKYNDDKYYDDPEQPGEYVKVDADENSFQTTEQSQDTKEPQDVEESLTSGYDEEFQEVLPDEMSTDVKNSDHQDVIYEHEDESASGTAMPQQGSTDHNVLSKTHGNECNHGSPSSVAETIAENILRDAIAEETKEAIQEKNPIDIPEPPETVKQLPEEQSSQCDDEQGPETEIRVIDEPEFVESHDSKPSKADSSNNEEDENIRTSRSTPPNKIRESEENHDAGLFVSQEKITFAMNREKDGMPSSVVDAVTKKILNEALLGATRHVMREKSDEGVSRADAEDDMSDHMQLESIPPREEDFDKVGQELIGQDNLGQQAIDPGREESVTPTEGQFHAEMSGTETNSSKLADAIVENLLSSAVTEIVRQAARDDETIEEAGCPVLEIKPSRSSLESEASPDNKSHDDLPIDGLVMDSVEHKHTLEVDQPSKIDSVEQKHTVEVDQPSKTDATENQHPNTIESDTVENIDPRPCDHLAYVSSKQVDLAPEDPSSRHVYDALVENLVSQMVADAVTHVRSKESNPVASVNQSEANVASHVQKCDSAKPSDLLDEEESDEGETNTAPVSRVDDENPHQSKSSEPHMLAEDIKGQNRRFIVNDAGLQVTDSKRRCQSPTVEENPLPTEDEKGENNNHIGDDIRLPAVSINEDSQRCIVDDVLRTGAINDGREMRVTSLLSTADIHEESQNFASPVADAITDRIISGLVSDSLEEIKGLHIKERSMRPTVHDQQAEDLKKEMKRHIADETMLLDDDKEESQRATTDETLLAEEIKRESTVANESSFTDEGFKDENQKSPSPTADAITDKIVSSLVADSLEGIQSLKGEDINEEINGPMANDTLLSADDSKNETNMPIDGETLLAEDIKGESKRDDDDIKGEIKRDEDIKGESEDIKGESKRVDESLFRAEDNTNKRQRSISQLCDAITNRITSDLVADGLREIEVQASRSSHFEVDIKGQAENVKLKNVDQDSSPENNTGFTLSSGVVDKEPVGSSKNVDEVLDTPPYEEASMKEQDVREEEIVQLRSQPRTPEKDNKASQADDITENILSDLLQGAVDDHRSEPNAAFGTYDGKIPDPDLSMRRDASEPTHGAPLAGFEDNLRGEKAAEDLDDESTTTSEGEMDVGAGDADRVAQRLLSNMLSDVTREVREKIQRNLGHSNYEHEDLESVREVPVPSTGSRREDTNQKEPQDKHHYQTTSTKGLISNQSLANIHPSKDVTRPNDQVSLTVSEDLCDPQTRQAPGSLSATLGSERPQKDTKDIDNDSMAEAQAEAPTHEHRYEATPPVECKSQHNVRPMDSDRPMAYARVVGELRLKQQEIERKKHANKSQLEDVKHEKESKEYAIPRDQECHENQSSHEDLQPKQQLRKSNNKLKGLRAVIPTVEDEETPSIVESNDRKKGSYANVLDELKRKQQERNRGLQAKTGKRTIESDPAEVLVKTRGQQEESRRSLEAKDTGDIEESLVEEFRDLEEDYDNDKFEDDEVDIESDRHDGKPQGQILFDELIILDPMAEKEDYYDEILDQWDVEALKTDLRAARMVTAEDLGEDQEGSPLPYSGPNHGKISPRVKNSKRSISRRKDNDTQYSNTSRRVTNDKSPQAIAGIVIDAMRENKPAHVTKSEMDMTADIVTDRIFTSIINGVHKDTEMIMLLSESSRIAESTSSTSIHLPSSSTKLQASKTSEHSPSSSLPPLKSPKTSLPPILNAKNTAVDHVDDFEVEALGEAGVTVNGDKSFGIQSIRNMLQTWISNRGQCHDVLGLKPIPKRVYIRAAERLRNECQKIYNKMLFDAVNDEIERRRKVVKETQYTSWITGFDDCLRRRWQRPTRSLADTIKAANLARGKEFDVHKELESIIKSMEDIGMTMPTIHRNHLDAEVGGTLSDEKAIVNMVQPALKMALKDLETQIETGIAKEHVQLVAKISDNILWDLLGEVQY